MRCYLLTLLTLLALPGMLAAQSSNDRTITVAPGTQADIVMSLSSPNAGDMLDVLSSVSDDSVDFHFFLPDGREITEDVLEQSGFALSGFRSADIGRLAPSLRKAMLTGTGDQFCLMFLEHPPEGDYRIRVDARMAKAPARVSARFIRAAEIHMDAPPKPAVITAARAPWSDLSRLPRRLSSRRT
jgi:hypothetical protein